jgi:hypothetical protein
VTNALSLRVTYKNGPKPATQFQIKSRINDEENILVFTGI